MAAVFLRLGCNFQNNATTVLKSLLHEITFLEKEPLEPEIKLKKINEVCHFGKKIK